MKYEWIQNLNINYIGMTTSEKKVVDFLLSEEARVGNLSLRDCASGAGVGQQTVVRMLKSCGYDGWQHFVRNVWQNEPSAFSNLKQEKGRRPSIASVVQRSAEDSITALTDFVKKMNLQDFQETVRLIRKARNVDIYGLEGSSGSAALLAGKLLHLGIHCRMYSDMFFQKISAEHMGPRDVAIGISQSGQTRMTVGALKAARESRASVIVITGHADSEIARYADYCFITPSAGEDEEGWVNSRVVQAAFSDMLYQALVLSDPEGFRENLEKSGKEFKEDLFC